MQPANTQRHHLRREGTRYMPPSSDSVIHVLWINAGLSCDGDSVSLTAAMQPSVEDIALGALPGLPKVQFHWPLVDFQVGDEFMEWWWKADGGALDPFVLVIEGSIPNEAIKKEGYWCGFGNRTPGKATRTDQPMTTSEWIDRLATRARRPSPRNWCGR